MYCIVRRCSAAASIRYGFIRFQSQHQRTKITSIFRRNIHAYSLGNEKKLLKLDKVPSDYELIYRLNSTTFWKCTNCFFYVLCIGTPIIIFGSYFNSNFLFESADLEELMLEIATSFIRTTPTENLFFAAVLILLNTALYLIVKQFPYRIYYNGERYVAIYSNSFLPFRNKCHYFEKGRTAVSIVPGLSHSGFRLGKRRANLLTDNFRRPCDLLNMINTPYLETEIEE